MFNEYDVVKIRQDMPEYNLVAGMTGTILMIYSDAPPTYEVEFSDDEGDMVALLTLSGNDLEEAGN